MELSRSSLRALFEEYVQHQVNQMAPDELKSALRQYMMREHFPEIDNDDPMELIADWLLSSLSIEEAIKKLQKHGMTEAEADEALQFRVFGQ